jgi:hypothetical protein
MWGLVFDLLVRAHSNQKNIILAVIAPSTT